MNRLDNSRDEERAFGGNRSNSLADVSGRIFDRYVAVDWSSANKPKSGKDSIWIGITGHEPAKAETSNPKTRSDAMDRIRMMCIEALSRGDRILIGFDFAFGLPFGGAAAHAKRGGWQSLWERLESKIRDGDDNASNRFDVAAGMNIAVANGGPRFWGHPSSHRYEGLTPTKPPNNHGVVAERRLVEARNRGTQPVWKLCYPGSVGSQALLGISRLEKFRQDPDLRDHVAIWPFQTAFSSSLDKPIILAEIFPSIVSITARDGWVKDREQVAAIAQLFAHADSRRQLERLLSMPPDISEASRNQILDEEGWIVGIGHEALVAELREQMSDGKFS